MDSIRDYYGNAPRVSEWLTVDQTMIDKFAEATKDDDWLHTDPIRAAREGPLDGTIAHGFWTISMLTYFVRQTFAHEYPENVVYALNYGFDRVRFIAPVPIGARIRGTLELRHIEQRGEGRFLVKTENRVEIEGSEKPAMIAEWLVKLIYSS